jgi:CO/xanthine dehydrogenase FAD-binding subunit
MTFDETAYAWCFGAGITLSKMSQIFQKISHEKEKRNVGELSLAAAYSKALETLGSPQIRNVACVGGSVFYNHPCSDLLPLHIACDAW